MQNHEQLAFRHPQLERHRPRIRKITIFTAGTCQDEQLDGPALQGVRQEGDLGIVQCFVIEIDPVLVAHVNPIYEIPSGPSSHV